MSPTPSGANLLHSVERQEHIGLERPDEVAPDALAAVGHRTALPTREADGDGAGRRHGSQGVCRARSSASLSETGKKRRTVIAHALGHAVGYVRECGEVAHIFLWKPNFQEKQPDVVGSLKDMMSQN